jgi:hypothetical protein
MKKSNLLLNLLLAVLFIGFVTACEDEPVVEEKEGLPVADGFYITQADVDPVANQQLKAAKVDAPDFGAMDREGFVQAYVYLTAGSYNVIEVVDKQVGTVLGGTVTSVSGADAHNMECGGEASTQYSLVNAVTDGAAFSIPSDGLYVVTYDATLDEIIFDEIESVGIIGGGTPGGWGEDTDMVTTITAEGLSAVVEGVTLDVGEMKFRYNCRWAIDRRIDTTQPFDNANGYSFFTNYGGSINQLLPGNEGSNIQIAEYAVYTVNFAWDALNGATATLTKTGEAEPKPEYPAELYMIGGSIGGWDWTANGIQMIPVHSNPHLFWRIVWIDPALADPGIKFAPQAAWAGDFGKSGDATNGVYAKGTDNVPPPATAGYYTVVVNLDASGETIEVNPAKVYGIGDAFGSWDGGQNLFTESGDVLTSPAFAANGDLRMYTTSSTFLPVGTDPAVDWWQAEFVVLAGVIEYRGTGGDQSRAAVTAGGTVSLNFKEGTGTIQ